MSRFLLVVACLALLSGAILVAHEPAPFVESDFHAAARRGNPRARGADTELAGRVRSALHATFGATARHIGVAAQDGFVSLYGEVPSVRVRLRAERIAAGVAGVHAVNNGLLAASRAGRGTPDDGK